MQLGVRFHGSSKLETSVADEEIIPIRTHYYKFSLMNDNDCTVSINDSEPIFLRANQGLSMNQIDVPIRSFKFLEDGVTYNWLGGER